MNLGPGTEWAGWLVGAMEGWFQEEGREGFYNFILPIQK